MAEFRLVHQPGHAGRLGDALLEALASGDWTHLRAAVAFVKISGVKHLSGPLQEFLSSGQRSCKFVLGIDQQGSSLEGVEELFLICREARSPLFILRNPAGIPSPTFHPKVWYFTNDETGCGLLIIGSGNLTEGGLFTNYEAGVAIELDSTVDNDSALMASVEALFDSWTDMTRPNIVAVDESSLQLLHDSGELPSEGVIRRVARLAHTATSRMASATDVAVGSSLFGGEEVPPAPGPPPRATLPPRPIHRHARAAIAVLGDRARQRAMPTTSVGESVTADQFVPRHRVLRMTVRPRQKTELYLTKGVLDDDPAFFGAPFAGRTTPKIVSNPAQPQPDPLPTVSLTVFSPDGGVAASLSEHSLKMWVYTEGRSANGDFRITLPSEMLERVPDDSVLVMERDPEDGLDYALVFYPPGHPDYAEQLLGCSETIRNSERRYGWTN